jgi:hypothetical protein
VRSGVPERLCPVIHESKIAASRPLSGHRSRSPVSVGGFSQEESTSSPDHRSEGRTTPQKGDGSPSGRLSGRSGPLAGQGRRFGKIVSSLRRRHLPIRPKPGDAENAGPAVSQDCSNGGNSHVDAFTLLMRAMEEKTRPKVAEFGFVQTTRPVARQWDLRGRRPRQAKPGQRLAPECIGLECRSMYA